MDKLVSAVIPTYNYGRFVGRAIDSVLAQTYPNVQCIVVDDGSRDETPAVLARYGGRIRAVRQENQGLSAARNTGICAAAGEYVALLDADDFWRPDKLATQVAMIEASPELGAVGCGVQFVAADGTATSGRWFPDPPTDVAERLRAVATRRAWIGASGSGALIPKRVLDELGLFDVSLRAAEDWDMWLRIASRYPFRNVPDALTSICLHGTGSFRNAEKMEHAQWQVYQLAITRWPEVLNTRTRRQIRALILADAGGEYVHGKAYGMAVRRYLASLQAWPANGRHWYLVGRLLLKQMGI